MPATSTFARTSDRQFRFVLAAGAEGPRAVGDQTVVPS
jgi:hypothetical protein